MLPEVKPRGTLSVKGQQNSQFHSFIYSVYFYLFTFVKLLYYCIIIISHDASRQNLPWFQGARVQVVVSLGS